MRAWIVIPLLLTALVAGCVQEKDPDADDVAGTVPVVPTMDAAALLADLKHFSKTYPVRADNTADHIGARDWLDSQFSAAGNEVWRQAFEKEIPQENIVGIHWGEDRTQWVVIGAHYDMTTKDCRDEGGCVTRPYSEGAYDDGSGTVMLVHLARAFSNLSLPYTIAFAAFDGEERGLQGSDAFYEAFIDGDHPYGDVTFRAMLNLDMFGINWPAVDAPIYFDENSPELQAYVKSRAAELGIPEDMIAYQGISLGRSDYAHFMKAGIPTGFFISSFETWQLPGDVPVVVPATGTPADPGYPFWHLQDTYETMEAMAGSADGLRAGFQVAVDLATGVVHFMAADAATVMTGTEA